MLTPWSHLQRFVVEEYEQLEEMWYQAKTMIMSEGRDFFNKDLTGSKDANLTATERSETFSKDQQSGVMTATVAADGSMKMSKVTDLRAEQSAKKQSALSPDGTTTQSGSETPSENPVPSPSPEQGRGRDLRGVGDVTVDVDRMMLPYGSIDHSVDMGMAGWANLDLTERPLDRRALRAFFFLLLTYYGILGLGLTLTYQASCQHNNVKLFSKPIPGFHATCTDASVSGVIQAFNTKPKVGLRVTSRRFAFTLDMSSWVRDTDIIDVTPLMTFLREMNSPLNSLRIRKEVSFPMREEVEKRLRTKLRNCGVTDPISIKVTSQNLCDVYWNHDMANFYHARSTRLLLIMSVFGMLYWPYEWSCSKTYTIISRFKVALDVDRFWSRVEDRISARGFS